MTKKRTFNPEAISETGRMSNIFDNMDHYLEKRRKAQKRKKSASRGK